MGRSCRVCRSCGRVSRCALDLARIVSVVALVSPLDLLQWGGSIGVFVAMVLLARKDPRGWLLNFAASLTWVLYSVWTAQWGLCALNVCMAGAAVSGWIGRKPAPLSSRRSVYSGYCCPMAKKFMTGVTGVRRDVRMPMEAAEYIIDWRPTQTRDVQPRSAEDVALPSILEGTASTVMLGARYCQWCGADISAAAIDRHYRRKPRG